MSGRYFLRYKKAKEEEAGESDTDRNETTPRPTSLLERIRSPIKKATSRSSRRSRTPSTDDSPHSQRQTSISKTEDAATSSREARRTPPDSDARCRVVHWCETDQDEHMDFRPAPGLGGGGVGRGTSPMIRGVRRGCRISKSVCQTHSMDWPHPRTLSDSPIPSRHPPMDMDESGSASSDSDDFIPHPDRHKTPTARRNLFSTPIPPGEKCPEDPLVCCPVHCKQKEDGGDGEETTTCDNTRLCVCEEE